MIIDTKFDIGDTVFFYEDSRIQSGVIGCIKFEKSRFFTNLIYEFTDGFVMMNPSLFATEEDLVTLLELQDGVGSSR